jgi:glycerate 2-kinase
MTKINGVISMKDLARQIFAHALAEASIPKAFARHVDLRRGVLRVGDDLFDLDAYNRHFVVSIGKAANTMVEALAAKAGELFEGIVASSVVGSSVTTAQQIRGYRYFLGGHPTPNADSVLAAEAVLRALRSLTQTPDQNSLVLFLISGGGSSILEKPIDDEISLADLIATYKALVLCGAPIAEINAVRKHLSAVKGGRLALAANGARQVSLLVSDVPDATPDALASGPTMPDSTSVEDCRRIVEKHELLPQFPPSVRELFERNALEETPKSDEPVFIRSRWWTILSNKSAVDAAAAEAARLGFAVEIDNSCDDWDYDRAAEYLVGRLRELRQNNLDKTKLRVCLISGGEVTVKVTRDGGIGGRNQQFALACAGRIAGENITVLSGGTDGIDGNSPAAGAVVDGTTVARSVAAGLDTVRSLASFDAYPLFQTLGDSVVTRPTGNNVRDLRILLADRADRAISFGLAGAPKTKW